jgi:hypothetical protein
MGLKDVFRRHPDSSDSSDSSGSSGSGQEAPDRDSEPGSVSSQLDVEGRGPVSLDERTKAGGQASPDTKQGKTEPMPATPGEPDPNAEFEPPSLDEMNVGGSDAQAPSHPDARLRDAPVASAPPVRVDPGVAPDDERGSYDPDAITKLPEGPERPAQTTGGTARRAPTSQGVSPEQQETDVQTGAANMRPGGGPAAVDAGSDSPHAPGTGDQPGDARGVAVPHDEPAPGTSEESPIAQGVRAPEAPGT